MEPRENDLLLPKKFPTVPKDRLLIAYVIFYLLGIGTLLPWNFFSNARQYFMYKFRNQTIGLNVTNFDNPEYETNLQIMFESYLTVAAMVSNIIFMFINTALTKAISLKVRINIAAITMILLFVVSIVLSKISTDKWEGWFFVVTILSIVIMNGGSAVLQGGIFGLSGLFPQQYTQAVMGGMGMGGTIAAASSIVVLWVGSDPLESGFYYFLIAEIFIVLALVGYWVLPLLKFVRYHTEAGEFRDRSLSTNSGAITSDSDFHETIQTNSQSQGSELDTSTVSVIRSPTLMRIYKKIWLHAFCVFLTFFITLSCYPAVNAAIASEDYDKHKFNAWGNKYFVPVSCFLLFNLFDWIGRILAGPIQWPKEDSTLLPIAALSRLVFIPIFLLCNVQPGGRLPVYFVSDWIPMITMVFFALSNGYLGTLFMMYGPRRVVEREDVETAGSLMSFFLTLGLGMGSLLSLGLLSAVTV